ncbi:hypothetical protein L210DRAFT_3529691 [Boletus edulis BED1]|uniref:RBR-type E3 ubiquitin transferase n=1 Tax=Boletus edulis BED1 TaxID=1328754 RepID=A0AAD4C3L5_BOLED|nr:hypothetical protein L210DRAFT_3529691 [Boletus edulis BED1]
MSQFSTSRMHQPNRQIQRSVPLSTQVLTLGKDHIVSFEGTSQFTAQGVSACGLAAFNFARIGFRIEQSKQNLADVLNELSTKEVIEEIVAICAGWSSNLHLEVDDIHDLPIFGRSLKLMSVEYGRPRPKHFQILLETMKKIERSAVMIITRPPEIIACFKFANANAGPREGTLDDPLFVIFDSHPRPSHPDGAGLSFSASIESTARTLSDILPALDEGIFDSPDFQWQAQLLSNCSAHVYVGRHRRKDHEDAIVQSSLTILTLRSQISGLRRENETLGSDNRKLELEAGRLRADVRQEQMKTKREAPFSAMAFAHRMLGRRPQGLISHAAAGSSRVSNAGGGSMQSSGAYGRSADSLSMTSSGQRGRLTRPSVDIGTSGAHSIFADNPPPVPSKTLPPCDDLDLEVKSSTSNDSDDLWIQTVYVARGLQDEFDSEDRRLRREHAELAQYIQATFQCSICMEELPEDDVAKVDDCVHTICRSCLRGFVASKIQEHRYPIFCPMCTIAEHSNVQPAVISRFLIEQVGVSEEQSQILTEMEMAEFTVQVHCRECRRPTFVDRQDYSDAVNIVCPQRDCQHVWCKKCEQTIVIDGPKHSCDGSNELDHLMKEKGWKHCPNCATPIQKESGCNHMSCISPGCNSHFCYICGGMIVRSALNQEINNAVSVHFRKCQLFEVPN